MTTQSPQPPTSKSKLPAWAVAAILLGVAAAVWILLLSVSANLSQTAATPTFQSVPTDQIRNVKIPPTWTGEAQNINVMPGCTVSTRNQPDPTQAALFPAPGAEDWSKGPLTATVTILEYSDFQCPGCAALAPVLDRIQQEFPNDVRLVFRHNPLIGDPGQEPYPFHDKAALSAQAAEAAGRQGKFWEMYARLFSTQAEWVGLPPAEFETWLKAQANLLELDQTQFQADLTDPENVKFVQRTWDINSANKLLFTPILVINNNQWPEGLPKSYEMISAVVKLTLLEARQFTTCPPMEINPQDAYTATIHTTKGELVLQLFADKAPLAVNSFVFLARHGWYNNVSFHRVIPGFMAQAGDPTGTGFGGPGYAFQNEIYSNVTFDQAGVLAMANAGPDTNGSQFFITYEPTPNLNGGYTIFGQLIEGLDVLQALTPRDPSQEGDLPEPDVILRIEITESSQ